MDFGTYVCAQVHSVKLGQLHIWASHALSSVLPDKEVLNVIASAKQSRTQMHLQSTDE